MRVARVSGRIVSTGRQFLVDSSHDGDLRLVVLFGVDRLELLLSAGRLLVSDSLRRRRDVVVSRLARHRCQRRVRLRRARLIDVVQVGLARDILKVGIGRAMDDLRVGVRVPSWRRLRALRNRTSGMW